jgi:Co/Zn/Cd efflux system component
MGALISTIMIWVLVSYLLEEAVSRLSEPEPVNGPIMFVTAVMGVIVNLTCVQTPSPLFILLIYQNKYIVSP